MEKKSEMTPKEKKSLITKMIIRIVFIPLFVWVFSFIPAGTILYWQVYVYFAVLLIPMVFILCYFYKNDPKFLDRRTKVIEKEKVQLALQLVLLVFFLAVFTVSAFDVRFGWSNIPFYIVIIADVFVLAGYLMVFEVFKQNSYASRIIEVEKNQKVISDGLYAIVRHPMYLGVLIMYLPTPIALGSYWALLPMATIPVGLVLRIMYEEKSLKKDLPGYTEYCQKVRYHLIPYIW